ncbi:hypothetical protein N7454_005525 [Penicillium verhagenii]|nr:hypothetical protein N7454_005525 [Penicillium verhagenii]
MVLKPLFLGACLAWNGARALSLHQRDVPAVVKLPIQRGNDNPNRLAKRADVVSNSFVVADPGLLPMYYFDLAIGTPLQTIQVGLDTSSGYLAVTATNSSWCKTSNCSSSIFDIGASSTYQFVNDDFNHTYAGGGLYGNEVFIGDFGSDDVVIDDISLPAMDLAVNYADFTGHVLGLGYIPGKGSDAPATILQALIDGGHIKSAAYSLWVDDSTDEGADGTILFGGVNKAKYTGELHTMSIPALDGVHYLPVVLVTEVTLQNGTSSSRTSDLPAYMALDSLSSKTFLPNKIVEGIYQDLNVLWDDTVVPTIACALSQSNYNITFTFIGFSISSPLSDFIGRGDGDTCEFDIIPSFGETLVLADNFLRNAYVVYDLSNNEISMAPRNFEDSEDQILEIGSGTTSISGVFESTTAVATVPTAVVSPSQILYFPAKSTSSASTATSTSSKGLAAAPTANSNKIMAGLVGAGLLMAL